MKLQKQSDESIAQQVRTSLSLYGGLDAMDIKVRVKNGDVYLSGLVDTENQKHIASDAARVILGVSRVNNELHLRGEANGRNLIEKVEDFRITREVKAGLKTKKGFLGDIAVETRDGIVTLSGQAKNEQEWAMAQQIAMGARGSRSVRNNLTIAEQ